MKKFLVGLFFLMGCATATHKASVENIQVHMAELLPAFNKMFSETNAGVQALEPEVLVTKNGEAGLAFVPLVKSEDKTRLGESVFLFGCTNGDCDLVGMSNNFRKPE